MRYGPKSINGEMYQKVNINQVRYVIDESGLMIGRRKGANTIAVVIMGLSLLILIVFILVTLNIASFIEKMREDHRLYVYLADGMEEGASRDLQLQLLRLEGVEEVVFVSRDEALLMFRSALGDDSDILDVLESNPLPDEYRVKLKPEHIRSEFMEKMTADIGKLKGVEEVRYGKRWLERGERLVKGFYLTDLVLGLIIFLSVIFVISNTVRLTVLSRRETINVMKLVGATNAYIQVPFIIEGALQGIAASLLAIGLLSAIYVFGTRYLPDLVFLSSTAIVGFLAFCAILGALGSFTAMRRHLKI